MKKFLALLLSLVMVLALVACGDKKDDTNTDDQDNNEVTDFKVGFIMLHDENSTYDLNFINAAKEACETLGVEYTIVTNVPEGQECYDKAAELADAGCNIIFADSFGPGREGLPRRAVLPLHRHQGAHRGSEQLPQRLRFHL